MTRKERREQEITERRARFRQSVQTDPELQAYLREAVTAVSARKTCTSMKSAKN
jgi:hypothetical protein